MTQFKDLISKIDVNERSPFANMILKWCKKTKPIVVFNKTIYCDYDSARSIHIRVMKSNKTY